VETIDLAGTWSLREATPARDAAERPRRLPGAVPMRLPGDNYSALIDSGQIPDPYYGTQELDTLWVGRSDWSVTRSVTVPREFCQGRHVFLHVEGLDTCAELRLNDTAVAEACNMFAALREELQGLLRPGENRIEILFRSAEEQARTLSAGLAYPVPHTVYPVQSPHRNLIRKVQCHAGWDWGPCLMVSGVYGPMYLGSCSVGRLDYVTTETKRTGRGWELGVAIEYQAYEGGRLPLHVQIAGASLQRHVEVDTGLNRICAALAVPDVELWWPAGHGHQALYPLSVIVGDERRELEIGFRTLELAVEEDESGRGMMFVVNGREVYCKGANWIPSDALPARQTRERCERLLSDAVAANMNMLRVWGGGQYESEDFYRLCDQKGILVWQDFMFSCSTYPAEPWFLSSVSTEVRHQVKRLQHHPCLAIWCGNNENVGALGWFPETRENLSRYRADYERLNDGVVGALVRELDPNRPWWPSSPSAGPGDYADNWHDDARGDMHYWSVWHEGRSFESYYDVTPRFCSEFGFQSFPSLEGIRRFAPAEQWNVASPVMEHHQRSPRGNTVIMETMTRYFRMPEGFESFLYLSQVQQALAIRTAVEYWRSSRPLCMGTLYWQLNDVWPGASWSSIEHSGKWKLLHYAARRFFAPVHVAVHCADGVTVRVVGLNDTVDAVSGKLVLRLIDFGGRTWLEEDVEVALGAEAATPLRTLATRDLPFPAEEGFLAVRFIPDSEGQGGTEARAVYNEAFFAPYKRCALPVPKISTRITLKEEEPLVELVSDLPAFFVALDPGEVAGVFEDNLFALLPGEPRTVRFAPRGDLRGPLAGERLKAGLKVFHLRATYR
jgi:beta-mannosidase